MLASEPKTIMMIGIQAQTVIIDTRFLGRIP
jgi:hypothetical protein